MEKGKIIYLVLKNLYNGKILSNQELSLSKKEYAEILDQMQKDNLIAGVTITNLDQERFLINNQKEAITVLGINYLMENTILDREYKILVSIDEIVNGIELTTSVNIKGETHRYKKIFYKALSDIDIETEAFLLVAECLKREKENRKHAI